MDLQRILIKEGQKPPSLFHSCGLDSFPQNRLFMKPASKDCTQGFRSFSCPNSLMSFPIQEIETRGRAEFQPTVSLTYMMGELVEAGQVSWRSAGTSPDPLQVVLQQIMTSSVENLTRTMSCPEAFSWADFIPQVPRQKPQSPNQKPQSPEKMSYADVAKMNLTEPACKSKKLVSSQRSYSKKDVPPRQCKLSRRRRDSSEGVARPKHPHPVRSHTKKPLNKRHHDSLKRELGTKRNNQTLDRDGSLWCMEVDAWSEETPSTDPCSGTQARNHSRRVAASAPRSIPRIRCISSESEVSSDPGDCLSNPRLRSLSECSVASVDSEDSFIVFEDVQDDSKAEESYDYSSSDDSDESSSGYESWNGKCDQSRALTESADILWKASPPSSQCGSKAAPSGTESNCPLTGALKKVRFACGEALAQVRKLCVWDYAHRAARVGPWEQAARDRDRFAMRVAGLASVIDPVLDSQHRKQVYNSRFNPD